MQPKVGLELLDLVGPPGRFPAEHNRDVLLTHGAAARRTSFLRFIRCARSDVVRSSRSQFFFFADAQSKNAERLPNKFPGFSPSFGGGNTLCSRSRTGRKGSAPSEKLPICSVFLVLPVRIELTTSPLPRECSTTELRQLRRDPEKWIPVFGKDHARQ